MAFDIDLQDLEHNIPQSAWEMVTPNIAHDDITTNITGFSTIQNQDITEDTTHEEKQDNTKIQQIHYVCYMQKQQKSKI